jgi:hypothetical protein
MNLLLFTEAPGDMVGTDMCVVGLCACSCCNTGARYEGFPRLSLLRLNCLPYFGAITHFSTHILVYRHVSTYRRARDCIKRGSKT